LIVARLNIKKNLCIDTEKGLIFKMEYKNSDYVNLLNDYQELKINDIVWVLNNLMRGAKHKKKTLSELYFGNIQPNVKDYDINSEFGKVMKIISENEAKLIEILDNNEKELFVNFTNAEAEIIGLTRVDAFIDGFKLGANIMLEITSE